MLMLLLSMLVSSGSACARLLCRSFFTALIADTHTHTHTHTHSFTNTENFVVGLVSAVTEKNFN